MQFVILLIIFDYLLYVEHAVKNYLNDLLHALRDAVLIFSVTI